MTSLLRLAFLAVFAALAACSAQPEGRRVNLDQLFERLRTTASAQEAEMIEIAIAHAWASSGVDRIDSLMAEGMQAATDGDLERALALMDRVVDAAPEFAEGWNMRANVNILRDDLPAAIGDIEHVLQIEPRHFQALAGLGRVFLLLDEERAALRAFEAALAINPHLRLAKTHAKVLRDKLLGIPV